MSNYKKDMQTIEDAEGLDGCNCGQCSEAGEEFVKRFTPSYVRELVEDNERLRKVLVDIAYAGPYPDPMELMGIALAAIEPGPESDAA